MQVLSYFIVFYSKLISKMLVQFICLVKCYVGGTLLTTICIIDESRFLRYERFPKKSSILEVHAVDVLTWIQ